MKFEELNKDELITISGGSEASDALCYYLGKGAHYFCNFLGAVISANANTTFYGS